MDVLRRAGVEVTVAGVQLKNSIFAQGSRKINIVPDVVFEEQGVKWDAVSKSIGCYIIHHPTNKSNRIALTL